MCDQFLQWFTATLNFTEVMTVALCPVRVKNGDSAMSRRCPLYRRKRTLALSGRSGLGQKRPLLRSAAVTSPCSSALHGGDVAGECGQAGGRGSAFGPLRL